MSKTPDKIKFFDDAARRERISPPEYAQVGKAVRHTTGVNIRSAIIQEGGVGADSFTCKLLDADGEETGDEITVYPRTHLGTNDLNGVDPDGVWPELAANDPIPVYLDLDGFWYTIFVFDDAVECP